MQVEEEPGGDDDVRDRAEDVDGHGEGLGEKGQRWSSVKSVVATPDATLGLRDAPSSTKAATMFLVGG